MSPLVVLAGIGPVLLALLLGPLDLLRRHHDHARVLLPNHAPEVDDGVGQAALRRDVRLADEVVVLLAGEHAEVAADGRQ